MEQLKHLEKQTPNGVELNLDALYQIAPSCFTEAVGEEGELRRVVDFDKLRLLLGDNAVENAPEVYDFTWVGKRNALREAAAPINKTLRPCPEESLDWDTTQNLYIEGDNLEVLKLLQNSYMGKVKMIYIDPPYNTGSDSFTYVDDYSKTIDDYEVESGVKDDKGTRFCKNTNSNGRFHSDWCSMIYARLMVARSFLKEDGAIFISIDDNEEDNMKKLCNEVFGENNFIACVTWQRNYAPIALKKFFSESHEYCYIYAKNIDAFSMNLLPRTDKQNKDYKNPDNDPRGVWKVGNLTVGPAVEKQIYEIVGPTGKSFYPPSGYCWRFTKEKFEQMRNDNRIWFGANGNNSPVPKLFLTEVQNGVTPMTLWTFEEAGHNQIATRELRDIFGSSVFASPKPVQYIERFLHIGMGKNDIILDFFSGSATTAHAMIKLNSKDGGNRKFIMVQLPEETDEKSEAYKAGYKNICEIGKERIRRAGKKIKEESPLTTQDLDTGFRVFKCESSNYKDVVFAPKDYSQETLDLFVDNIKDDRTDLDLLFDCMLRWGVELSLPLSKTEVDGCTIHNVNDGDLVACFNGTVTENVIDAIAELSPLRVVFRDSSFEEAAQKMNLFELFKQRCGWTDEEVRNNVRVI